MSETLKPEIREQSPFPPKVGELMVRKIYHLQPSREPGTEVWKLSSHELHFYDEVGKPGDSWHSQRIARIPYPDEGYGEPNFNAYPESATEDARIKLTPKMIIEHVHASDADLDTYIRVLGKYFEDVGKKEHQDSGNLFQEWLDRVNEFEKLLPAEKVRVAAAFARYQAQK